MTPDQMEFSQLKNDVAEIKEALLGDAFTGKLGFIHHHNQMYEDLYGIGSDGKEIEGKKNTVLNRISKMEDNQRKLGWIVVGICTAFTAAKLGFAALCAKIFEK